MSEWWTYRPRDLLLFSETVYWRLFELANAALWPWPLLALALGATLPVLAWRRPQAARRGIPALLAAALLVSSWAFLWRQYRPINWAAGHAAALFAVEAALLLWIGVMRGRLRIGPRRRGAGAMLGWAIFGAALVLYPFAALTPDRSAGSAEIFAVAPDPTMIAILGLLVAAAPGSGRSWLLPIPLLWCCASAATLLTLGTWEGWLPLGAAAAATLAVLLSRPKATPAPS